jgi:uncharacterized protein (TIRG00374 family)
VSTAAEAAEPRRRRWAWIVAWVVATGLLVLCFRVVGAGRALAFATHLKPGWVTLSLIANFAIQLSAALMWRLLMPAHLEVSYKPLLRLMLVGSLLMNTTPMLVGHASMTLMLARERGVGHAAALSVLALDQLAEGLSKVMLVVLAVMLVPVPDAVRNGGAALAVTMLVLLVALFVIARHHELIARWSASRHRAAAFVASWAHHLEVLRTPSRFLLAWLASIGMKACELLGIMAAQHALGVPMPLGAAVLVLAAAALGTVLPLTPGNLGIYEGAVLLAYRFLGVPAEEALALALIQHLSYLAASTIPGWLLITRRQFRS